MSKLPVKIYSLSTCSHCKLVKKLLENHGVEYDFDDVDQLVGEERAIMINEVKKYNPKCTFPTVVIGDTVVVGNKENEIKELLGI